VPPFSLIVFDLDGTLVDSKRDLANATNSLLVECGAAPLPDDRIGRMVGDGAATLVARAFEASGIPRPADALERFLAIYSAHLLDHTRPYPDVPDVLAALAARADLAVLTNKPLASTRRILEGLTLSRYFAPDAVVGGDGPFPRKPDPAGLRHLMTRSSVDAGATLLVGDSAIDLKTARAASTAVYLVRYGFGFDALQTSALRSNERVIDTLREVSIL
jgi:phosphoglycolate phosphatase